MDTNDYCAVPLQLKDQVNERYPGARRAVLKTDGDFPFLSRPDEVNLYLQLHLRRVGVEAKPELVKGFSGDGNAGSSMGENNGGDHFDNSGKNHEDPEAQEGDSDLAESFNSETHDLHQQMLASLQGASLPAAGNRIEGRGGEKEDDDGVHELIKNRLLQLLVLPTADAASSPSYC